MQTQSGWQTIRFDFFVFQKYIPKRNFNDNAGNGVCNSITILFGRKKSNKHFNAFTFEIWKKFVHSNEKKLTLHAF